MNKIVNIARNAGNTYIGDSPEYRVNAAINELLNQLASEPFTFRRIRRRPSAETIVKIKHNNIQSKKHIIKQYLDHSSAIETALASIDSIVPFGKQIVLQNLNDLYYSALDELQIDYLTDEIDVDAVREHSEFILDFVIQKLKNTVFESKNTPALKEQIEHGINVVVAHAFIECVIMENPSDDS